MKKVKGITKREREGEGETYENEEEGKNCSSVWIYDTIWLKAASKIFLKF